MDYSIAVESLKSRFEEITSACTTACGKAETSKTALSAFSGSEISSIINTTTESLSKLTTLYNSSDSWCKEYMSELISLEERLVEEIGNVDTFAGTFEDIFSKKTLPTIQTGGDKEANILTEENRIFGNTQLEDLLSIASSARNGDSASREELLNRLSIIADPYCKKYGFAKSVLLAQIIQESGPLKDNWLTRKNNILSVNYEMFGSNNDYKMAKTGERNESAAIPNWASYRTWASGTVSGGANFEAPRNDAMRAYNCIEDCIEDYIALMVGYRPYINGANYNDTIEAVKGYAEDANYASSLRNIIAQYNLTRFDA